MSTCPKRNDVSVSLGRLQPHFHAASFPCSLGTRQAAVLVDIVLVSTAYYILIAFSLSGSTYWLQWLYWFYVQVIVVVPVNVHCKNKGLKIASNPARIRVASTQVEFEARIRACLPAGAHNEEASRRKGGA